MLRLALVATVLVCPLPAAAQATARYEMVGDAIPRPLLDFRGDVGRGRAIVVERTIGNCLICHTVPEPNEHFMGNIGPDLKGVGSRLTAGQIRLRMVDQTRINPASIMPPYHRTENLTRVPYRLRGRPAMTAQQIEDVVAYLSTLKD